MGKVEEDVNDPVRHFWQVRLQEIKERLNSHNFVAYVVETAAEAGELVLADILPTSGARSLSYGGSGTLKATGLHEFFSRPNCGYEVIRADEPEVTPTEKYERRRQALSVDMYFSGVNAVTGEGHLVNLDMIGNRVSAITFGPRNVTLLVGRNKIVRDLESARLRIKELAAPVNAMRLDAKTPCVKTSHCVDCSSPGRICNTWMITEKSFPKGRIRVVLINEDLGI